MDGRHDNSREHLKLLSIFHYVIGGFATVLSLFSLVHIGIGLSFILPPQPSPDPYGAPSPGQVGWFFLIAGLIFLILGLTLSICLIASGRFLATRTRYWFSFVVACIECLFVPIGTLLGIFTIIVLSQDSTKALYGLHEP